MPRINVLVTTASSDFWAEVIAESVAERSDMSLVESRCVKPSEVDDILESLAPSTRCALVLVGRSDELDQEADRWARERRGLVVMYVDMGDDIVRIGLRDPRLDSLLSALRELVESAGKQTEERVARIQLRLVEPSADDQAAPLPDAGDRPLLRASIEWVHSLLRRAVEQVPDDNGDVHGFAVTRATILQSLDPPSASGSDEQQKPFPEDEALDQELALIHQNNEPFAVAARVLGLGPLEFRMMLLMLAPELDIRFQRCIGFLLDEMGRRVGTIGLYCSLLDISPQVRGELINAGALTRWLVFEGYGGRPPAADDPLRCDSFLAQWLLGDRIALESDQRVKRILRPEPWPGSTLLERHDEIAKAVALIDELRDSSTNEWVLLDGEDASTWGAVLELGARNVGGKVGMIRVDALRLPNVDVLEIEDCGIRLGRMARLMRKPLVIDISGTAGSETEAYSLRILVAALRSTGAKAAIICPERAHIASLLGNIPYEVRKEPAVPMAARVAAMQTAATKAGVFVTAESADALANQYPLDIGGLEHAMFLALGSKSKDYFSPADSALTELTSALKEFAAEGISKLVDRIEPIFSIEQVVLPPDRTQQLYEIVDHVRLAPRVLDGWKFREQLPYGRGVAALFFGSSGTGKTMAAMGIARQLGIQILRLDLSRVVSKYIGDTEKNLDRVFTDAQRSGAVVLIDEADALFGKRSEVKDAHDRYANIEVAYLLQRMEAYEGIAILTTNLRKNLDPAFVRRMRFIVEFPEPDAEAREKIWRQCLPIDSHELSNEDFRQLARRINLTGGNIRQITLRAAFVAAAADQRIRLEHVAQATRAELTKLGLPPVDLDLTRIRRAA